jgi:hypothetical protein
MGSEANSVDFPMFAVQDDKAVALADYAGQSGKVGVAYKDLGDWQSLYIGAVGLYPPALWRDIARLKKVHVYSSDGDALWADKSLVAVHAARGGLHTVDLPALSHVVDLWSGRDYGQISVLKIEMKTGDNLLLWMQPLRPR